MNLTSIDLYLEETKITDTGAQGLADALKENANLTNLKIDLIGNNDIGTQALADALSCSVNLTDIALLLGGTEITDIGV